MRERGEEAVFYETGCHVEIEKEESGAQTRSATMLPQPRVRKPAVTEAERLALTAALHAAAPTR